MFVLEREGGLEGKLRRLPRSAKRLDAPSEHPSRVLFAVSDFTSYRNAVLS